MKRLRELTRTGEGVLALLVVALLIEYVILGKYSFIQIHDFADDIFPRYVALWRNFAAHGFQTWSSDIGAGTDRLSNLVKYDNLLSLLVGALPAWLGYQVYIVVTTWLGAWAFFKMSTKYLGRQPILSAWLAVSIPLVIGVINSTGLSAGIQFYPFAIFCIYWADSRFGSFAQKLLVLTGAFYLTSITVQFVLGFIYLAPFLAIWFVCVGRVRTSTLTAAALAFIVVLLVHFGDLQALTALSLASHRTEFRGAVQTTEGATFFIGQIALAVACAIALFVARIRDRRLLVAFAVFLLITIGDRFLGFVWTAVFGHTALGTLKISRLGFFSTSLLGAVILGVDSQLRARGQRILTSVVALNFFAILLILKLNNAQVWIKSGNYVANFESPALQALRASDRSLYRVAVFEGVTHANMLSAYGFESADGYSPMYPRRYKHFWGEVVSPVLRRDAEIKGYFQTWGSRFYLFTGNPPSGRYESVRLSEFANLPQLSLANVKYIIAHQPVVDDRLELVSAGVNAMKLGSRQKLELRLRENFRGRQSLFIYRNKSVLPRAFSVGALKYFPGERELLAYGDSATAAELAGTALEIQPGAASSTLPVTQFARVPVTMTYYSPSHFEFNAAPTTAALVVISSALDAGWRCVSGGRDLLIADADEGFSAVTLPAGATTVSCRYKPNWIAF